MPLVEIGRFLAVFFCGLAIKLLDDFLDHQKDALWGRWNWVERLGPATAVYGMAALAVACSLDAQQALPLFWAAYALGMVSAPAERYPSGTSAWMETISCLVFCGFCFGLQHTTFALFALMAVQCIDDVMDSEQTPVCAAWPLVGHMVGRGSMWDRVTMTVVGSLCGGMAVLLDPMATGRVGAAAVLIWVMARMGERLGWKKSGEVEK
ncbi:MAG TPA: hypothetical protein GXZ96_00305 [Firmicutes bacterium]|jgi:hypothetical protein|nr:hypothetical protein [Bacillota bacterium]